MFPLPTSMIPLQQHKHKDCSLLAVMNCAKLNTPELEKKFHQSMAEPLMEEYNAKSPVEAFYFLKQK